MLAGDAFVSSGLVNLGYFPCASDKPSVAITTRVLEMYRVARNRCPRLAIQPFVKSLCDIHGVAFRPYLSTQFSVAFDLYLAVLVIVDKRDEQEMLFPILTTHDGNNSLKRFERRERKEDGAPGASKERVDDREVPGDYYLSREEVDRWGQDELELLMKGFSSDPEVDDEDPDGCSDRWENMKEEITSKAWGMYDETGVFLSLCRHGFVLLIADMIKSGELAKYGYAVTHHLIKVLGEIASGYDIGCKFGKMVNAHPVLGPLARVHKFRSLVGAFHGHGHNRRCQLGNLATYVTGVGLDDLEYCETFFSKSNALAASTRYATRFHRQQTIATYLQHTDVFDTYQSLSLLLANKYKRALEVKNTEPALVEAMRELDVPTKDTFKQWLEREKEVLRTLSSEPLEETLQMEYWQKLVNLEEQTNRMDAVLGVAVAPLSSDPTAANYAEAARATRRLETQRRHAIELRDKIVDTVHDLEHRLGIAVRWERDSPQWVETGIMVQRRRYQRTLDQLQALIISRMFELTKMNMSGTGYKLRKHIAKALQSRSRAVKTALTNYNAAAANLNPPRAALTWEQVVEYAFLSDFDLLRDGRDDIRQETWATPAGRLAMDMYFKIERSDEEIVRLNIEIRRFVTYMRDEDGFLWRQEQKIRREHGAAIAHQVRRYRMRQGRFNEDHRDRLFRLSKVPGFTGTLEAGTPVNKERLAGEVASAQLSPPSPPPMEPPESDPESSDSDSEEEADAVAEQFTLMRVTEDSDPNQGDSAPRRR
ncbi:hypothetical protein C8R43DRAFT_1000468 [Mycena crocata]|nr:hypothetical protein C8R43DRAFT_1000468 [Mycena crocata]